MCINNCVECKAHCYTSEDKMSLKVYNKVGNGLRTGTEMMPVFTWKTRLSMLEWTCICLHLFFQASYYVPKTNSEWMTLWGSIFVFSQWLLDQMHMVYKSKDDFLAAITLNSFWDHKIKHCSFWAHVKCSQQNAKHIKSTGCCISVDLTSLVLFSIRTAKMLFSSKSRLNSGTTLKLENENVWE